MFSDAEWAALIGGLVTATQEGRVHWMEREPSRPSFIPTTSIASILGSGDVLIAQVGAARYEVSAAPGGGAPYGLFVVETVDGEAVVRGSLSSSTALAYAGVQRSNSLLKALYEAARGTIEESRQVVARLLQDLNAAD